MNIHDSTPIKQHVSFMGIHSVYATYDFLLALAHLDVIEHSDARQFLVDMDVVRAQR